MTAPGHDVAASVTLMHAGLLAAMVAALAFEEKLHAKKSVITGVAAVAALLLGEATGVMPEPHGHMPLYIPMVDWGVIAVILGSSLFVAVSAESGIFSWLAIRLTKATGGDPLKLLVTYGVLTVLFSALLNNVTAMVIVGSLTAVSLKKIERDDLIFGFLLSEGLLTNIGGLLTLISSVPNIIVGTAAGISFMKFFLVSAPYVTIATALTLWMSSRLFKIRALTDKEEIAAAAEKIAGFDENDGIHSKAYFYVCWFLFAAFILTIATTNIIPGVQDLGIGFVAFAFGIIVLLSVKSKADEVYAGLDWDLLFFFVFLFVVIGVIEHGQVLAVIGRGVVTVMKLGETAGPLGLLFSSAVASSVTDNIPLAAMLAKTLSAVQDPAPLSSASNFWWALIYGANLGGNITPIGSASTVVAVTIIHKNKLPLSFFGFVRRATPFAAAQLALAGVYVAILGFF